MLSSYLAKRLVITLAANEMQSRMPSPTQHGLGICGRDIDGLKESLDRSILRCTALTCKPIHRLNPPV